MPDASREHLLAWFKVREQQRGGTMASWKKAHEHYTSYCRKQRKRAMSFDSFALVRDHFRPELRLSHFRSGNDFDSTSSMSSSSSEASVVSGNPPPNPQLTAVAAEQLMDRMLKEKLEAVYGDITSMNQRIKSNNKDIKALSEEVGSMKGALHEVHSELTSKMDQTTHKLENKLDLLLAMVEKTSTDNGHVGNDNQASILLPNDTNLIF